MIRAEVEIIRTSNVMLNTMMNYGYGNMMGSMGVFGLLTWLVILVDLVLVGIWLWQRISKK